MVSKLGVLGSGKGSVWGPQSHLVPVDRDACNAAIYGWIDAKDESE